MNCTRPECLSHWRTLGTTPQKEREKFTARVYAALVHCVMPNCHTIYPYATSGDNCRLCGGNVCDACLDELSADSTDSDEIKVICDRCGRFLFCVASPNIRIKIESQSVCTSKLMELQLTDLVADVMEIIYGSVDVLAMRSVNHYFYKKLAVRVYTEYMYKDGFTQCVFDLRAYIVEMREMPILSRDLFALVGADPNLVVAGGFVCRSLIGKLTDEADIDIFVIRANDAWRDSVRRILAFVGDVSCEHSRSVVTIPSSRVGRPIQIIMTNYDNAADVLHDFDYAHVKCGYYMGKTIAMADCASSIKRMITWHCRRMYSLGRYMKATELGFTVANIRPRVELYDKGVEPVTIERRQTTTYQLQLGDLKPMSAFDGYGPMKGGTLGMENGADLLKIVPFRIQVVNGQNNPTRPASDLPNIKYGVYRIYAHYLVRHDVGFTKVCHYTDNYIVELQQHSLLNFSAPRFSTWDHKYCKAGLNKLFSSALAKITSEDVTVSEGHSMNINLRNAKATARLIARNSGCYVIKLEYVITTTLAHIDYYSEEPLY